MEAIDGREEKQTLGAIGVERHAIHLRGREGGERRKGREREKKMKR